MTPAQTIANSPAHLPAIPRAKPEPMSPYLGRTLGALPRMAPVGAWANSPRFQPGESRPRIPNSPKWGDGGAVGRIGAHINVSNRLARPIGQPDPLWIFGGPRRNMRQPTGAIRKESFGKRTWLPTRRSDAARENRVRRSGATHYFNEHFVLSILVQRAARLPRTLPHVYHTKPTAARKPSAEKPSAAHPIDARPPTKRTVLPQWR